jgi:hypothetical protein
VRWIKEEECICKNEWLTLTLNLNDTNWNNTTEKQGKEEQGKEQGKDQEEQGKEQGKEQEKQGKEQGKEQSQREKPWKHCLLSLSASLPLPSPILCLALRPSRLLAQQASHFRLLFAHSFHVALPLLNHRFMYQKVIGFPPPPPTSPSCPSLCKALSFLAFVFKRMCSKGVESLLLDQKNV